jgi:hypothetical protein
MGGEIAGYTWHAAFNVTGYVKGAEFTVTKNLRERAVRVKPKVEGIRVKPKEYILENRGRGLGSEGRGLGSNLKNTF